MNLVQVLNNRVLITQPCMVEVGYPTQEIWACGETHPIRYPKKELEITIYGENIFRRFNRQNLQSYKNNHVPLIILKTDSGTAVFHSNKIERYDDCLVVFYTKKCAQIAKERG